MSLHKAIENNYLKELEEILKKKSRPATALNIKNKYGLTPLHFAAFKGYLKFVEIFIRLKAKVDLLSKNNKSALHYAVENKHFEVVKYLVSNNANTNIVDSDDLTPLHYSVKCGTKEIVEYMINNSNVNPSDKLGLRPLHYASRDNKIDFVNSLLQSNDIDVNAQDVNGVGSLHFAARNGHTQIVKMLLDKKAQVDAKDNWHWTPLHFAADQGHDEIVKLLLSYKADINAKTDENENALNLAIENGHFEVTRTLNSNRSIHYLVNSRGESIMYQALISNNAKIFRLIVNKFYVLKGGQHERLNALLIKAISMDNLSIVKLLVEYGANVNYDWDGYFPLHYASSRGHLEIAKYLTSKGAIIEKKDNGFKTPLDCALQHKNDLVSLFLIQKSPRQKSRFDSPLLVAIRQNHFDIVKLLIENGANVDEERKGCVPLHSAAKHQHDEYTKPNHEIIEYLVSQGAKVDKKDMNNKYAYEIACCREMATFLIRKMPKKEKVSLPNGMQLNDVLNSQDCNICYEPRNGVFAFLPCGHSLTCETCARILLADNCPCCRRKIESYSKIYIQ